jgi:hypothetical protein
MQHNKYIKQALYIAVKGYDSGDTAHECSN